MIWASVGGLWVCLGSVARFSVILFLGGSYGGVEPFVSFRSGLVFHMFCSRCFSLRLFQSWVLALLNSICLSSLSCHQLFSMPHLDLS